MDGRQQPYLSLVVTTRNDDHGGDPLRRLRALVSSFDEQCRRTGLSAEVVVVEWNPAPAKPSVRELLSLPAQPACDYRFIEVPPQCHDALRHADALPLFQMIAKNVGIRRSRGRFVLATNIDILLSSTLVEHLAAQTLVPDVLYRVDRHDVQTQIPDGAPLEAQMAFCESHQLRVHGQWGTRPVDATGHEVVQTDDIADGATVKLVTGWHVVERSAAGPFRWASETATISVEASAIRTHGSGEALFDVESNPYDPDSWVDVCIRQLGTAGTQVERTRVRGRARLRCPVEAGAHGSPIELELCVVESSPDSRRSLPLFEQRESLCYRVYSVRLAEARGGTDEASIGSPLSSSFSTGLARWKDTMADALARGVARLSGVGLRNRIARLSADFRETDQALRTAGEQLRSLEMLHDIATVHEFLRVQRPANLHVNACGDFQLMAREQWEDLHGYPEFEMFSMNIDGLFSYIAQAAGVQEQLLPMPIYHLEHETGSGWSPEGEGKLRARIAERGIKWLDAPTVYIWAAYMRWLGRPVLFNGSNWGMGDLDLPELTVPSASPARSHAVSPAADTLTTSSMPHQPMRGRQLMH
jgi:hypothetical protein